MEVPALPHLVCRIKEGQQPLLLHSLQDAAPLLKGGVHAGGVVRAGMQHHNSALWGILQILQHSLQCQRDASAGGSPLWYPVHPAIGAFCGSCNIPCSAKETPQPVGLPSSTQRTQP